MRAAIRHRSSDMSAALRGASLPPLLKRLYANRGVSSPHELELTLKGLIPPTALKGVQEAAEILADAIEGEARVVIVGDFDADGATSSALAVSVLQQMGLEEVSYLVPNRFEFGYGLSPEIVALAAEREPDLIVTVDNGIASYAGVATAQGLGISVVVTDHHLPGDDLPPADAIVNPNQFGCRFPSKALAGVGVMFYVLTVLRAELKQRGWFEETGREVPNLADTLDLVALGTVADVVPLDKNNRILVAAGVARMRSGRARPGIEALLEVAGRDAASITATDLGFVLGPRLNAAGRLEDMSIGIECLLAKSSVEARPLAQKLHDLNRERRDIEASMQTEAMAQLEGIELGVSDLPFGLCLYDSKFHQGVVGILASRLRERYHRPTIVFADAGDDTLKGSGRSIEGLHLRDVLDRIATSYSGLVSKFGGHAMAAGLTIAAKDLALFTQAFDKVVAQALDNEAPESTLMTDGELEATEMTLEVAQVLTNAGPWGQHFPVPVFDGVFRVRSQRIVGEKHLKLVLEAHAMVFDAIAINVDVDQWPDESVLSIGAVYKLDINDYRGERRLQLLIDSLWPET